MKTGTKEILISYYCYLFSIGCVQSKMDANCPKTLKYAVHTKWNILPHVLAMLTEIVQSFPNLWLNQSKKL